jgi:hypothetical protein
MLDRIAVVTGLSTGRVAQLSKDPRSGTQPARETRGIHRPRVAELELAGSADLNLTNRRAVWCRSNSFAA